MEWILIMIMFMHILGLNDKVEILENKIKKLEDRLNPEIQDSEVDNNEFN